MKSGTSFVLGLAVGLGTGLLLNRLKAVLEEEDPDRVFNRLQDSLEELEVRARNLESRLSTAD